MLKLLLYYEVSLVIHLSCLSCLAFLPHPLSPLPPPQPRFGGGHKRVFKDYPKPKTSSDKRRVFENAVRFLVVRHPFDRHVRICVYYYSSSSSTSLSSFSSLSSFLSLSSSSSSSSYYYYYYYYY